MLTKDELIEAQDRDIQNLLQQLKEKDMEIAAEKTRQANMGIAYKFDTPYFRMDKYNITCYKLVNVVFHKWHKTMVAPNIDTRFTEVFTLQLSDLSIHHGCGGNRRLTTCISYDKLMDRLNKRLKSATKINNTEDITFWTDVINKLDNKLAECTASFDLEVR
jgi:hypothetical protein